MVQSKKEILPASQSDKFILEEDTDHIHHSHSHSEGQESHSHVHSEESLRRIVNRLSRIEGHIRGVKTMVQESKPCPDVLVQIAAVRGALDRVARMILDEHLTECIARAAKEGNMEAEIEQLKAALDRFLP
ncbi:metal-sensing transcriptional repressor [Microseira sp. BLCC-F43]|jgi:DNA-binding FrmR family transcriptional regulator|uniref:metal-sensing transcriptional repressor n=1 Tax=Microseira sp. BLCC-F43 TaxID=3153602 RepID=UPI0035B9A450